MDQIEETAVTAERQITLGEVMDDSMTLADKITNVFERLSRMEGVSASEMTELSRLKDNLLDSMRNVTDGICSTMSWYEETISADESDYITMG